MPKADKNGKSVTAVCYEEYACKWEKTEQKCYRGDLLKNPYNPLYETKDCPKSEE